MKHRLSQLPHIDKTCSMEVYMYTRIRADIDLSAVKYNFDNMAKNLTPGTQIAGVIKADAYGHGAVEIARLMENVPYMWGFAVATAGEALVLREAGIKKPILILGYSFIEDREQLITEDVRMCVFDEEAARDISRKASKLHKNAYIHIALDTGMGRIGFLPTEESLEEIRKISEMPNIVIEGLFTHFARADETDLAPALIQFERYQTFSEKIRALGIDIPIRHVSNSAGIIRFREANLNMVRAGITIYGLYPSDEVEKDIVPIRPVMSLVSHISYVKTLPAGYSISYGGTFTTQRESRVATIPVGYADGYPRQLSGKASVLIRGKRAPILGRVCMDQFMVDVTDIPDAQRGDEVVLVGTQGDEHITVEELGAISGRFNYEFVCNISPRVPRCYVNRG